MMFGGTLTGYMDKRPWWIVLKPVYVLIAILASLLLGMAHSSYMEGSIEINNFSGAIEPAEVEELPADERILSGEFTTENGIRGNIEASTAREGFWGVFAVYLVVFGAGYFIFRWFAFKLHLQTQRLKLNDRRRRFLSLDAEERYYKKLDIIKDTLSAGTENWQVLDYTFIDMAQEDLDALAKAQERLEDAGTASHTFYEIQSLLHYYNDRFEEALEAIDSAIRLKGSEYDGAKALRQYIEETLEEIELAELEEQEASEEELEEKQENEEDNKPGKKIS